MFWTRRKSSDSGNRMKFYAGIGSRSVNERVGKEMKKLAISLNEKGYTLRSGNADGSDQWFAKGVSDEKAQIWLPWKEFNVGFQLFHPNHIYKTINLSDTEAYESVPKFYPNVKRLGLKGYKFMARNYRQVIGLNEPNSQFVICWTPDGKITGGTGQAWRVALHYHIPVYNMFDMSNDEILKEIEKLNLLQ